MARGRVEIQVFTKFPRDPTNTQSCRWFHCLTFPLDTFNKLRLQKPYKWMRYATGIVVGAQGHLSFSRKSTHNIIQYDNHLPHESAKLYYHMNDDDRDRVFPADPDMGRTHSTSSYGTTHITSSCATTGREDFKKAIVERDGTCVLTGFGVRVCNGVHLLAHRKGNEYIEHYTQGRTRDHLKRDIVCDIDDPRNGILLNKFTHPHFGTHVAFLMTPNFAMKTTDVFPTASTEKRCTAHLFVADEPELLGNPVLSSGDPVRMPDDADQWPPDILFDAVYANAVVHHFTPQSMKNKLAQWKSTYYPEGITSAAQASQQAIANENTTRDKTKNKRDRAQDQRAARRKRKVTDNPDDYFDSLMIMPYLMTPPEEVKEHWRKVAEERAEREQRLAQDKVAGWRLEVANACS